MEMLCTAQISEADLMITPDALRNAEDDLRFLHLVFFVQIFHLLLHICYFSRE